jgi:hypothetical protein
MEMIELDRKGLAYVPIFIKPKDRFIFRRILFKLDTGAGMTTISKTSLNSLGYSDEWVKEHTRVGPIKEVSSAGGKYEPAYCVIISDSTLFGKTLKNWPFYIRPEEDRDYRNLLGVDIVSYFDFTFSYRTGCVSIEAIDHSVIKYPMLDNQSIDELD